MDFISFGQLLLQSITSSVFELRPYVGWLRKKCCLTEREPALKNEQFLGKEAPPIGIGIIKKFHA